MTAARKTEADRLRRHRVLFERAMMLGCTLEEARRRDAEARWAATDAKLAAKRCGTVIVPGADAEPDERELPWWHR